MEQRTFDEFELALVIDIGTGEVARQQVRGELDAAETAVDGGGEGFHCGRLGQARQPLHQHMAVGQEADHQPVEQDVLTDDDARQRLTQFKDAGLIRHGNSSH